MRYFPIGAKSSIHIPLAIIEDINPESVLELWLAAPEGLRGFVPIDMGLAEV